MEVHPPGRPGRAQSVRLKSERSSRLRKDDQHRVSISIDLNSVWECGSIHWGD